MKGSGDYVPIDTSFRVRMKDDFTKIKIDEREYAIANIIPVFDCLFIHFDIKRMLKELGIPEEDIRKAANNFSTEQDYLRRCAYKVLREIYEDAKIESYFPAIEQYISQISISKEISADIAYSGYYVPYEPAPYAKLRAPEGPDFLEILPDKNYVIMTPAAMALISWVKKGFVDFMKDRYNVIIETGTQSAINIEEEISIEIENMLKENPDIKEKIMEILPQEIRERITEISAYEIASKNLYSTLEKEYVHKNKGEIVSAVIVPLAYLYENELLYGKIIEALPDYPIKIYKEIWKVVSKPKGERKFPDYYAYISAYGTALYIKGTKIPVSKSAPQKTIPQKPEKKQTEKKPEEEQIKKEEVKKEEEQKEEEKIKTQQPEQVKKEETGEEWV